MYVCVYVCHVCNVCMYVIVMRSDLDLCVYEQVEKLTKYYYYQYGRQRRVIGSLGGQFFGV